MSSRNKISLQELDDFVDDDNNEEYNENYQQDADFFDPRVGDDSTGQNTPVFDDGEMKHVVNQVVRLALAKELNGKKLRTDHIAKAIKHNFGRKVTGNVLIKEAKKILQEVYGLSLEDVSSSTDKQKTKPESDQPATKMRKTSGKGPYVMVSTLLVQSRNILGELWNKDLRISFKKPDLTSKGFFLPLYEKTPAPGSHYDLVKTGIMLLIISMIILNENHIQETILLTKLKKFGISDNLNQKNSNINMNSKDLLNDLTDKEYLLRKKLKGRTELEDIHDYSLGKRSLAEFTPQGVFEYIKIIYGDSYNSTIAEKTLVTIEKAYGVALNEAVDNNNNNNNADTNEEQAEE